MRRTFNSPTTGLGCLIVFALPFALVGLGVLFLALWPILRSMQAQMWDQVPAYIQEASIASSSGSDGGSTHHLEARYSYEVDGKRYESDVVSFYTGSDNIDTFHHDKLEELRPFIRSDTPYRAFVNPSDPEDVVLFPVVRWAASAVLGIFGAVFALVGFGIIFGGIWGSRANRTHSLRASQLAGEPWMLRKDWAERRVTCNSGVGVVVLAFVTLIWNGISSFALFAVYKEMTESSSNYIMLVFLLFPLVGLALIWGLIATFLRWWRFGSSQLTWSENPIQRNATLRATLIAPRKLVEVAKQLDVTLACQEHFTTGSGKNRSTRITTVSEQKASIPLSLGYSRGSEAHIPVKVTVPGGGEDTRESGNPRFVWKLSAHASIPGADYAVDFELPVFSSGSAANEQGLQT